MSDTSTNGDYPNLSFIGLAQEIDRRANALRSLVCWASVWIDDQIAHHGAVLTQAEYDAYQEALSNE